VSERVRFLLCLTIAVALLAAESRQAPAVAEVMNSELQAALSKRSSMAPVRQLPPLAQTLHRCD
jgi:hypothetical protein